jgi:hypothetical protein
MTETALLSEGARGAFREDAKIALLATVSPEGLPHVSLITSLQAKDSRQLIFGQFSEGCSKRHVKENPRVGFVVVGGDRTVWRGKGSWTHEMKAGEDFDAYNDKPMFRYNAYFGIHTVHYLDLVELAAPEKLGTVGFVAGSLLAALCRPLFRERRPQRILTSWAEAHLSRLSTLKFLSYVGSDGYPVLVPLIPARSLESRRLLFVPGARSELRDIEAGSALALFALNLQMESVLVRGTFSGYRRHAGMRLGVIDIDWVYNSMPPKQGQIYPLPAVATEQPALRESAAFNAL